MRRTTERGIAMIATMLVMLLISALMVGFTAVVMSDQRYRGIDRDRQQAFYAAHAGLEKLTADLGNLFMTNVAPTIAQVTNVTTTPPSLQGVTFMKPDGTSGYTITVTPDPANPTLPLAQPWTVGSGPYQGMEALKTSYTLDVVSKLSSGAEVHLVRNMETVAIPVFQFGMFSDVDLSFHAGANFNFGGRVHTNGNLFLAGGSPLTISDKVTAVKEIIRPFLSNGAAITSTGHTAAVNVAIAPGSTRPLSYTGPNESSITGFVGSAANPNWSTISLSTYNGYIRTAKTGAKALNLPLLTAGGANTDLVRRPATPTENVTNPLLFGERDFGKVSLRILLSDTAADITSLPTITAQPPISLESWDAGANPLGVAPVGYNVTFPRVATSYGPGPGAAILTTAAIAAGSATVSVTSTVGVQIPGTLVYNNTAFQCTGTALLPTRFTGCTNVPAMANNTTINTPYLSNGLAQGGAVGLIGGFIKIEMQDNAQTWRDVTTEILNYGFSEGNPNPAAVCGDFRRSTAGAGSPNPNAIIRLQRVADRPATADICGRAVVGPPTTWSTTSTDYWPLALFDAREALQRDVVPAGGLPALGGVMYYVELDMTNLKNWLLGVAPYAAGSGAQAYNNNGYAVYFSDRRNNRNAASKETAEYGFEDVINPADVNGIPNGVLDGGEDVNANGVLDTYGQFPSFNGNANSVPGGARFPLNGGARPTTLIAPIYGQANRPLLFRRALKLVNGSLGNLPAPGVTIVSENPVYVEGDWNASQALGFGNPHVATSIIADAVTVLSNAWNDDTSFAQPYNPTAGPPVGRVRAANSWYRFAVIAGKNIPFLQPGWAPGTDVGTDGGAHNFLRYLEGNGGILNYTGSIATFYYSRQAVGIYKCCNTVYGAPTRVYNFDTDFLTPALLPPLTPVFRDVNTTGFTQELRPGK